MEDPTRNYAIPTSAFSISRLGGLNETQSRTNLINMNYRGSAFRKKNFYRNAAIVLAVLFILILIAIVVITALYIITYYKLKDVENICTTEECLRSAANLRLSIDETIDPCEDFYKFTCGHWSNEHPNHGWYPKFSIFETIDERVIMEVLNYLKSNSSQEEPLPVNQARDLYKSCLDTESLNQLGYTVIQQYLKEVGLPLVPKFFENQGENKDFTFDLVKVLSNLKIVFAMNVLIQFDIESNIFNRSNYVLYIGSGTSGSPLPSPFKNKQFSIADKLRRNEKEDEAATKVEAASKKAIKEIFKAFIENVTALPNEALLERAVNVVWNISGDVSEMVAGNVTDMENIELTKFKVDDLQKLTDNYLASKNLKPLPIWKAYITYLFRASTKTKFDFDSDVVYISNDEIGYVKSIVHYIAKTPLINMELYCWWMVVESMIISTTTEIGDIIYRETAILHKSSPDLARSRSLECAELVIDFMGIAVSYGIADKAFMNSTKPEVTQMLQDIKEAFVYTVRKLQWMDVKTKEATLEKSREMVSFIGFPDWLLNKTAIELYYENITITATTFLENLMQFVKAVTPQTVDDYREENKKTWRTDPTTVNAYNYFGDNSINVPMAILTFPMYHLGLEVLNYGTIGTILGHELTHGFDNIGRLYDKEGNFAQWWTNETTQTFQEKSECFIEQYNGFNVPSLNMNVSGKLTLGENLADNGGLHHSYLAYQEYIKKFGEEKRLPGFEKYTNNQLFFIAFGSLWCEITDDANIADQLANDEHSPSEFRVLGALQNSHEFSEAFQCPLGSRMNPEKERCRIW